MTDNRGAGRPCVLYVDGSAGERQRIEQRFALRSFELVSLGDRPSAERWLGRRRADVVAVSQGDTVDAIALLRRARKVQPKAFRLLLTRSADTAMALAAVNEAAVHRVITAEWGRQQLDDAFNALVERSRTERVRDELARRSSRHETELFELRDILKSVALEHGNAVLDVLVSTDCLREGSSVSHGHRSARYAARLARGCELSERDVALVELGALLHDIGKLAIPDRILAKPSSLSRNEWTEMRRHPALGDGLLSDLPPLWATRPIVLQHHERWDGEGYPSRVVSRDISLAARICSVADTLDAMTSRRPYRDALSFERAWEEILACRGTQFDPGLVDRFEAMGYEDWSAAVASVHETEDASDWRIHFSDLLAPN